MNPYRNGPPPKWWAPKLNPSVVKWSRPFRDRMQWKRQRLKDVKVEGVEHLRDAYRDGCGIMITPNHASHADPFAMYAAGDAVPCPLHFMATWHVFTAQGRLGQWALQRIGVFSVDREGADLQAFKAAVKIMQESRYPLVIFPEGEIYHCNARLTPFREGTATIALTAARRAKRRIVCIPTAIKYRYLDDPTDDLLTVMSKLEAHIHWRPKTSTPLPKRIYAFAEALLTLKEIEYLGTVGDGDLPQRVKQLADEILTTIERRHDYSKPTATVPERIKEVRSRILEKLSDHPEIYAETGPAKQLNEDLDDIFFVSQLFSYPGDYVSQDPSVERMAETIDKFEEDVLQLPTAQIRGVRTASVSFGEPVEVESSKRSKTAVADLTQLLESRVQGLLDSC